MVVFVHVGLSGRNIPSWVPLQHPNESFTHYSYLWEVCNASFLTLDCLHTHVHICTRTHTQQCFYFSSLIISVFNKCNSNKRKSIFAIAYQWQEVALCLVFNLYFGSWSLTLFLTLINTPSKNKPDRLRSPSSSPWAIRSRCLRFGALTLHSLCFQWTGWELCNRLAVKAWLCLRIPNALYLRKHRPGLASLLLYDHLYLSMGECRSSKAHQCFYDVRGWIRYLAAAVGLRLGSRFFPTHAGIWSVYRMAGANLCSLRAVRLAAVDT